MNDDRVIEYSWNRLSQISRIAKQLADAKNAAMRKQTPQEYRESQKLIADMRPLPAEFDCRPRMIAKVPCELVYFRLDAEEERTIIYYHGGSWMFGDLETARPVGIMLCRQTRFKVLVVDYRRAPENQYPDGFNDCYNVYKSLIESGHNPEKIGIFGDSAGGNLSLAVLHRIKEEGLPMPACVGLASPATDLSDDSFLLRSEDDLIYTMYNGQETTITKPYLGEGYFDKRELPTISPVKGDLSGLPPILIHSGDEPIADDNIVFAKKVQKEGGEIHLKIWRDMFHDFTIVGPSLSESKESMTLMGHFFRKNMGESTSTEV